MAGMSGNGRKWLEIAGNVLNNWKLMNTTGKQLEMVDICWKWLEILGKF